MAAPKQFLDYVDANTEPFIERLSQAVAIPRCVPRQCQSGRKFTKTCVNSISGEPKRREDVKKMGLWLEAQLNKYGVKTELIPLGTQQVDGQILDLPPAIVGRIGDDPKKKTILIYGHFDVQPVCIDYDL